jgi:putative transposase
MAFILHPWQLLLAALAGWVNEQQQQIIEFQRTEIAVLKEKLGKRRILLNDDQRRRLAVKAKVLGRKVLQEIGTLFTPDTLLRWHRQLVAQKWDYSERRKKKPGRPPTPEEIAQLVVQMARENPSWGYDRIQGALANLGHDICDQTVGNILKAHGIEPVPERKRLTTWKTFIQSHWDVLGAIDFTTIDVWTKGGLVTFYLLFVMELATRRVYCAGCTPNPDGPWMQQVARNLTDAEDGFLIGKRYVIMDRDGKFCPAFRAILKTAGVGAVLLPPKSPNLNAHLERFHRSLREECLDRMIFFGETSLRNAVREF